MATRKTTTPSAGSKPATPKAAKATKPAKASQEQSPVSDGRRGRIRYGGQPFDNQDRKALAAVERIETGRAPYNQ